ncbi:hypothetical protein WR25_19402 [Diploscapter pachys]|uniref:Coiled-coil domain-containing protein 22 homolog n=1 Tax=Diploscapter pachys TaxID=2018661 RepID=A0A2A2K953_9BILA|nr:hypothetical protein WR25_19402 [Diploscapter pachys]
MEFLIRCIWLIDPPSKAVLSSHRISKNIAERFRAASTVSEYLKKLKLRGDISYQSLLYGSWNDLRKLFIDLIEKLPKENVDIHDGTDQINPFAESAHKYLSHEPKWVPEFCRRLDMSHDGRYWCPPEGFSEWFPLSSRNSADSRQWIVDLINSSNQAENESLKFGSIVKPPIPEKPHLSKPQLPPKPSKEALQEVDTNKEVEVKKLQLAKLYGKLQEKRLAIVKAHNDAETTMDKKNELQQKLNEDSRLFLNVLENPEEGKANIQEYLQEHERRMVKMQADYDDMNVKLNEELDKVKEQMGVDNEQLTMRDQIVANRQRIEELAAIRAEKEQMIVKAEELLEQFEPSIDRSKITKRILDMIEMTRRQKKEIQKIIADIRKVQNRLKWSQQSLDRTFSVIEETLFRDANNYKGERAYKLFAKMHEICIESIQLIEKNGAIVREKQRISDQIDVERQKNVESKLAKLEADFAAIRESNKQIESAE